jgi:CRP-like cAMP-binding protein
MNSSEKNSQQAPSCEFTANLDLLRQTYFFSGMPLESLKVFAYLCAREKFRAGEYLVRQAEDDGQAFYLISGRVCIERTENGHTTVMRSLSAGAFLGGLTLMGESPRLFSLRAEEETLCLVLSREKFTRAIQQYPDQVPRLLKAVVGAIGTWEEGFLAQRETECGGCLPKLGVSLL